MIKSKSIPALRGGMLYRTAILSTILLTLTAMPLYTQENRGKLFLPPNDSGALYGFARFYAVQREIDTTIETLEKAIAYGFSDWKRLAEDEDLANLRTTTWYKELESNYDDKTIEIITRAIQRDPNIAIFYNSRGVAYGKKGQFNPAIENFTRAIQLDPNDVKPYFNRGLAYAYKGEYDPAIEDFTRVIQRDPNFDNAYNNRGLAYSNKDQHDLALKDLTRAIQLDPNDAISYNNRGIVYNDKGQYDLAIEDFTRSIQLDPNYAMPYNNRGLAYSDKGQHDLAIEDFTKSIQLVPNVASTYNNRGLAYDTKGQSDLAIEDYTRAIQLDPNNPAFHDNRGITYSFKGQYDLAIEDHTRAIQLDPNFVASYNNRGLVYSDKGQYDQAIEDFTKAIQLDPNFVASYNNRGIAYYNKGQYDLAIKNNLQGINVAETNTNQNEILMYTFFLADSLYNFSPYLHKDIEHGTYWESFAGITGDALWRSIQRAEQIRTSLGSRGSALMTRALYLYYMGVDLEAHFGSSGKAFEYSESLRSRGFLEQMGTEVALRLPGISAEERQKVTELTREIELCQNILEGFATRPPQTTEETTRYADAGQRLSALETELAELDTAIALRLPRYGGLRNPKPASIAQAREWCGDNKAVLEYVLWDDSIEFNPILNNTSGTIDRPTINSYCLVIIKDGVTPVILDHDFDYSGTVDSLRKFVSKEGGYFEGERNALYDALIKPVLPYIPAGVTELVIVPDGSLGHLPFDILRENDASPDLGQTYRVSLSPSVSVSMLAEKTRGNNFPVLAFGGAWYDPQKTAVDRGQRGAVYNGGNSESPDISWKDLPGTEKEVHNLEQLVSAPDNIKTIMGKDVSELTIKTLSAQGELAGYPILHFACHGYFNEADVGRSGIVLSEVSGLLDDGEDGYLTIPEIVLLNLNARMVLLSACETGLGVLKRGDGMVGLARAFLVTGVENVGVSLWSIDDEATLEFMTRLYNKVLNEGKTFKEAYYLVKNEFRNDEKWSDPYYWAAFTLYE